MQLIYASRKWLSCGHDWWNWQLRLHPHNNEPGKAQRNATQRNAPNQINLRTTEKPIAKSILPPLPTPSLTPAAESISMPMYAAILTLSTSKTEMAHLHDSSIREIFDNEPYAVEGCEWMWVYV